MFTAYPSYSPFRTLELLSPQMRGEDVYALQRALTEVGHDCGTPDGILGNLTSTAIKNFQKESFLTVDGKAGGATQKSLALNLSSRVAKATLVPYSAFIGQLELESGYRLGIYSPQRPDGTYDAGVAQRNTKFTPPQDGFDPHPSIRALGEGIRKHYDLFAGIRDNKRRWALAQGAWNAPAFACYIAREEGATKVTSGMTLKPSAEARQVFEAYVLHASSYLSGV
jgi:hypothetical protein